MEKRQTAEEDGRRHGAGPPDDRDVRVEHAPQAELHEARQLDCVRHEHDCPGRGDRRCNAGDSPVEPDDERTERDSGREEHEAEEEVRQAERLVDLPVERLQALCDTAQAEELEDGNRRIPPPAQHHRNEVGCHDQKAEERRDEQRGGEAVDAQPHLAHATRLVL